MKSLIFFLLFIAGVSCAQNIADTSMMAPMKKAKSNLTFNDYLLQNWFETLKADHDINSADIFKNDITQIQKIGVDVNTEISIVNKLEYPPYFYRQEWINTITALVTDCTKWYNLCITQLQYNFQQLQAYQKSDAIKNLIENIAKQYINSYIPIIK